MKKLLFVIALFIGFAATAQTPIQKSNIVEMHNGKKCYVHILQKGQTVYSISRAYGVKEYEAITTKDIHQLEVGDTVWVPCKDENVPITPTVVGDNSTNKFLTIEVQAGQTLYGLSRIYGVSVDQILEANPQVAETGLKSGQTLLIPNKNVPTTQTTAASQTEPKANTPKNANNVPTTSAPSTPEPAVINKRVDADAFYISVMMPLYLDQISSISTTKFDLEQRGKKSYKPFDFIQFYEGIQMGIDQLEKNGIKAVVNIIDVPGNSPADVEKAWQDHNATHSDLVIALLTRDLFAKAAQLAADNHIFIVNPLSTRTEILSNPYVIKCAASIEGQTKIILNAIRKTKPNAHLLLVHSGTKAESAYYNEITHQLQEQTEIQYTIFDWKANAKLATTLKQYPGCVILNIFDQGRDKNRIQVSNLLNKLASIKNNPPTLITYTDYTKEYSDIDYSQLQLLSYHTFNNDLNADNQRHQSFMEDFRTQYKTEPIDVYAPLGHDIIIYFLSGLQQSGTNFFHTLSFSQSAPHGLIYPMRFKQPGANSGFENQSATLQKLNEFNFTTPIK